MIYSVYNRIAYGANMTNSSSSIVESYLALAASGVLWGLNYVPLKQYETGDGLFFQFMFAISVWICGFLFILFRGIKKFQMLAMIGGMLWSISNALTVPIVKLIGIGLGMLVWNSSCLIVGWSIPRFGLFGITKEVPHLIYLEYLGVASCLTGLVLFLFVKPEESKLKLEKKETTKLLINSQDRPKIGEILKEEPMIFDGINPILKRIIGIIFALCSGIAAAVSYIPILYIQSNYPDASQDQNDYSFAYNTGILFGAIIMFVVYCIIKKNQPEVYSESVLPTFISGSMWLAANTFYFIATNGLSQAITFPISNSFPCTLGLIVSVFYKEIKGRRNFLPLLIGIFFSLTGSAMKMDYIHDIVNTTVTPYITSTGEPDHPSTVLGFGALSISVLFFGSNFLPVKQFETGDGMFFQLILTTAIWTVGFIVYAIRNFPKFYALPMLGGFFWSTGNLTVVPIIKCVGIGLGALFWNTILLVCGWAIARFGLFGVKPEVPSNQILNYFAVVLCAMSGLFYLFVKSDSQSPEERQHLISDPPTIDGLDEIVSSTNNNERNETNSDDSFFIERLTPAKKRIAGIVMSVGAGILYAVTFTPALYVQDNYPDASENALDYVFSLYTGSFLSSVFYFTLYCIVTKNKPRVYPRVMLPALVSGWMWAIANNCFFLANNALTQAITFPIVSSGPSAICTLWGVVLYKEITGLRNFLILGVGFLFAIVGSILCGVSK